MPGINVELSLDSRNVWRRLQPVGFRPGKYKNPQAEACATLQHSRANHWNHPDSIAARIANVGDHLIEVRYGGFARDRRQLADGFGITVAPRLQDGRKSFSRDAQRV